jgi:hypothetical protein
MEEEDFRQVSTEKDQKIWECQEEFQKNIRRLNGI